MQPPITRWGRKKWQNNPPFLFVVWDLGLDTGLANFVTLDEGDLAPENFTTSGCNGEASFFLLASVNFLIFFLIGFGASRFGELFSLFETEFWPVYVI